MNLPQYVPAADTVRGLISHYAQLQPNQVYAVFPETDTLLTFKELEQEVQAYAAQFNALGLVQGNTISFMMGNGKKSFDVVFKCALYRPHDFTAQPCCRP